MTTCRGTEANLTLLLSTCGAERIVNSLFSKEHSCSTAGVTDNVGIMEIVGTCMSIALLETTIYGMNYNDGCVNSELGQQVVKLNLILPVCFIQQILYEYYAMRYYG